MKPKEVFKDIPNYNNYQISDLGNVKSLKRNIILKPSINSVGYYVVNLGKGNSKKIHQLMAIVFLNHKPCGHKIVVDHIDNDKLNNSVDNLQTITHRENLKKDRKNDSSKFLGVSWNSKGKKWIARVYFEGSNVYLGGFDCELKAAAAVEIFLNK